MLSGRINLIRGDAREIAVDAGTVEVLLGDLIALSDGSPVPASETTWDTNLATTQEAFVASFLGVALDKQLELDDVMHPSQWLVGTAGDYTYECDALDADLNIGQLMGPDENATSDGLEDQKVVEVATAARAIGTLGAPASAGDTEVTVRIRGNVTDRAL